MSVKDVKRAVADRDGESWTFLSNHGHVLVCIARDPELRLRDVADQVGITERAVQRIINELVEAGCVSRVRSGRRNSYQIYPRRPLRHPLEAHQSLGALLELLQVIPPVAKPTKPAKPTSPRRKRRASAKSKT